MRWRDERGSATLEMVIGVPVMVLFIIATVAAGRLAMAHQSVQSAAADAARTASIARTQGEARAGAQASAASTLGNQGVTCRSTTVHVDTSGFARPVGTAASVSATVVCVVEMADLALPGLPGSFVVAATMISPIDTYRGRR